MPRVSSHFGLQDPRIQSLLFYQTTPASVAADSNQTYTTDQVLGGQINRSGMSAGRTDTLPTAAQLCEAVQGCFVGLTFDFRVRNVNAGAFATTLAAGAGGTLLSGNNAAAAQNTEHTYSIRFTNVTAGSETYDLYSRGVAVSF